MSKILIVEDNELNRKLFCDLLTIRKSEVVVSSDGRNIIELTIDQKPDLVLMDIQLKGISGIDLIQQLKQNAITSHIPIIAITAFAMKNDEVIISRSGCDMYLSKPISIDNFFGAINQFVPLQ